MFIVNLMLLNSFTQLYLRIFVPNGKRLSDIFLKEHFHGLIFWVKEIYLVMKLKIRSQRVTTEQKKDKTAVLFVPLPKEANTSVRRSFRSVNYNSIRYSN